jgi:hypothetical protein
MKTIVRATVFFCVTIFGYFGVCGVFQAPPNSGIPTFKTFYGLPQNSVDVIYIGASSVYASWIPSKAFSDYGIASMELSSPGMPFPIAKNMIIEAKKTQSPKLFIVDLRTSAHDERNEQSIRNAVDSMKVSLNRFNAINTLLADGTAHAGEKFDYYFPITTYHQRWKELEARDFGAPYSTVFMGANFSNKVEAQRRPALSEYDANPISPGENIEKAVWELLDYCAADQESQYLFLVAPYMQKSNFAYINWTKEQISDADFDVLDATYYTDEMDIDFETDFRDINHFNIYGGVKYTDWFSRWLLERYDLPDRRGQKGYETHVNDYERFLPYLITHTKNMMYYLTYINNPRFTLFFSIRDEASKYLTDDQTAKLRELGFASEIKNEYKASFVGVWQDGNVIYEDFGNLNGEEMHTSGNLQNGLSYSIISSTNIVSDSASRGMASIVLNGEEYAMNSRGLNIVVWNNQTNKVIDSVAWDTWKDAGITLKR